MRDGDHRRVPGPGLQPQPREPDRLDARHRRRRSIAREITADYSTYLARSVDGGRTFGPADPDLRDLLRAGRARPERDARARRRHRPARRRRQRPTARAPPPRAPTSATSSPGSSTTSPPPGADVVAAGSDASETVSWRLPGGADPNFAANWLRLNDMPGERQPELASDAHGTVGLVRAHGRGQRPARAAAERRRLGQAVRVTSDDLNNDFELVAGGAGRLSALRTEDGFLYYATSTDGGTHVVLRGGGQPPRHVAVGARGRRRPRRARGGRRAPSTRTSSSPASRRPRRRPRAAASAAGRVQVRALCDGDVTVLIVEAKRLGARVGAVEAAAPRDLRPRPRRRPAVALEVPGPLRPTAGPHARPGAVRAAVRALAGRPARGPPLRVMFEVNAPNLLTVFRILLVPVLVAALLSGMRDRRRAGGHRLRRWRASPTCSTAGWPAATRT